MAIDALIPFSDLLIVGSIPSWEISRLYGDVLLAGLFYLLFLFTEDKFKYRLCPIIKEGEDGRELGHPSSGPILRSR